MMFYRENINCKEPHLGTLNLLYYFCPFYLLRVEPVSIQILLKSVKHVRAFKI